MDNTKLRKLDGTNIFRGDKISQGNSVPTELRNGKWVEARPIGYIGFWHTLNCAWLVLTHRADIVIWYEYLSSDEKEVSIKEQNHAE